MFYIMAARGAEDGYYLYRAGTVLRPGEVTGTRCTVDGRHNVPEPECYCGFWMMRPTTAGLARIRCHGPVDEYRLLAVRPDGRTVREEGGLVLRAEKVQVLRELPLDALLPPALRNLDSETLDDVLYLVDILRSKKPVNVEALQAIRNALGKGELPRDRLQRLLQRCEECGLRAASARCAVCRVPLCSECTIEIGKFRSCIECEETVRGGFAYDWRL